MSPAALSQVKSLAVRGLMTYQPFVFDETLECGVGYEFERDARVGLVHYSDILIRSNGNQTHSFYVSDDFVIGVRVPDAEFA